MPDLQNMICKNCDTNVNENYCPNCGQSANLKRIDGHYIQHEIEHVLHFEKGILYTIRELLVRPGENVRHFVAEDRSRLVKPIIFVIVTSLIYSLVIHFFHIEDGYVTYGEMGKSATVSILKWVQNHYGYANIMIGVFIAFWTKIFFKKYGYNFYEILILLCYVMGVGMLFYAVFALLQGLTHLDMMQIAGMVGIGYCSWAIAQFFDKRKPINYIKALVAYMLGMVTSVLTAILIGTSIDLVLH